MTKIILSIVLVTTFSLFGMGFFNPGGINAINNPYWVSGFYILVFSGLAGVGLIDLFNNEESVSRTQP